MRTGAPWRDLAEEFGNWNSIFRQFGRWADSGVWDVILEALAGSGLCDGALQMMDATASPQSASCLENSAIRPEVSGQTLRDSAQGQS
jgi:transposase